MIPVTRYKDRKVALFGLGGSGLASARALLAGGAELVAFDDNRQTVEGAAGEGIPTGDLREVGFDGFAALVLSPGVPLTHPKPHWSVELAHAAGVPIVGDIGLFAEEIAASGVDASIVAITGTNGKSTTTALIAHVLASAGRDVQMGGNIGTAVLALEPPTDGRVYVVECSSYQIDLARRIAPDIGVLLNISPDHLDRHGTFANYVAIKERLVAQAGFAVVGVDDEPSHAVADRLEASGVALTRISGARPLAQGTYAIDEEVKAAGGESRVVAHLTGIASLRGRHNAQNAAAAAAVCAAMGLSDGEIAAGLASFPGLAHRMQPVATVGRVLFVNDSKATNAQAAQMALSSFERIYWIAGGLAKEGGIAELAPWFDRIAKAYLIGEAAPAFAAILGDRVQYEIAGDIETAVAHAAQDAAGDDHGEPVVLLSPACASFDQFANFELRGQAFIAAVDRLSTMANLEETA